MDLCVNLQTPVLYSLPGYNGATDHSRSVVYFTLAASSLSWLMGSLHLTTSCNNELLQLIATVRCK